MLIVDIRHWLNESMTGSAIPELKSKVDKLEKLYPMPPTLTVIPLSKMLTYDYICCTFHRTVNLSG